ncbi:MAG: preprotein translocase subunit YajC [Clostridiales bacterium]|nr:preprotein translocase subunit YajC [Clostridiales bacterium]MCD7753510.1 preprotein translocase subunit YajC [Clostridiales bacterium]
MDESLVSGIVMLVVMIAIFYFMLIRPENKRKKEATEMRNSLAIGDEITTIGGIVGTICAVKTNSIVIETGADRVRLELMKWSVSSKGVQISEDEKASESQKAADAKKSDNKK